MEDSSGQLWIKKGSQLVKVDSSLNVVAGDEKNISLSRFYRIESPDSMLYVTGPGNDTVNVFSGSVDDFLADAADGTIDGTYSKAITVHNGELKYPTPYGARVFGTSLIVYTYLSTGSSPAYLHYIGGYDLTMNTKLAGFNGGQTLLLNDTYYNNYYHRGSIHIFTALGYLCCSYQDENGDLVIKKIE
ncbi:hypothetical protein MHK_004416 [Candidatus Magnetomorum sp. HK-1]|nr:hypothetical protein MHK_004416 [Candidatus Magnetomorum sp. HK-1]